MSFLASKYGAMAGAKMVRVMHLDGGGYSYSTRNWAINKIEVFGKFLVSPSTFYENAYASGETGHDDLYSSSHEQTFCHWRDDVYTNSTAQGDDPATYDFTQDEEWHTWLFYSNCWSGYFKIDKDGSNVRDIGGLANGMYERSTTNWDQLIFGGSTEAYIRRIKVYDFDWALKHDWNFENGDSIPTGWSNATIKKVVL